MAETVEDAARLEDLLSREYGIRGSRTPLDGENENYLIAAEDGSQFVLKLANPGQPLAPVELELAAQEALRSDIPELQVPRVVETKRGDRRTYLENDPEAGSREACLYTAVPGARWLELGPLSLEKGAQFGRLAARIALVLAPVENLAAHRTHPWDLARAGQHRARTHLVGDPARRRLVEEAFVLWCAGAEPYLDSLPQGLIHGDLNDDNLLALEGGGIGLVDFGDCLHNPLVCDLAIALAYLPLGHPDPLGLAGQIVAGYHQVRPLSRVELEVLFPLMCGRLAASVVISTARRRLDPEREAWFRTESRAWRGLEHYMGMAPAEAADRLAAQTSVRVYPERGTPKGVTLERRRAHISGALSLTYHRPVKFVRGRGQYLVDEGGRPYLDLYNNVCHVGHAHPRVVEAVHRQMKLLNTNTRYLYDQLVEYAGRLTDTLPSPLSYCFFVNSGSEANELALRLARTHTGNRDLVVLENAYHGHTGRLIEISPYKFMGPGGSGAPPDWVHVAPMPDGYRGPHKGNGREAGIAYGDDVGRILGELDRPVSGFIAESLPSCGGQIIPPEGYLETAFAHVRQAGGVCILDEVQVGFGRVGTHFWGFERQGVMPDIVVMGKPIGNGHPLGAVVTTREIAGSFADAGMEFFSTFGGNPVSCAVGLAVLDVIEEEGLQEHALEVGTYLRDGLRALMDSHALIGDVRGAGLFIGIELVEDRTTLEPATERAADLINALRSRRILTSTDGPYENVIKIKPPLVVSKDDADYMIETLDKVLK